MPQERIRCFDAADSGMLCLQRSARRTGMSANMFASCRPVLSPARGFPQAGIRSSRHHHRHAVSRTLRRRLHGVLVRAALLQFTERECERGRLVLPGMISRMPTASRTRERAPEPAGAARFPGTTGVPEPDRGVQVMVAGPGAPFSARSEACSRGTAPAVNHPAVFPSHLRRVSYFRVFPSASRAAVGRPEDAALAVGCRQARPVSPWFPEDASRPAAGREKRAVRTWLPGQAPAVP
jgi:hypothetical protein